MCFVLLDSYFPIVIFYLFISDFKFRRWKIAQKMPSPLREHWKLFQNKWLFVNVLRFESQFQCNAPQKVWRMERDFGIIHMTKSWLRQPSFNPFTHIPQISAGTEDVKKRSGSGLLQDSLITSAFTYTDREKSLTFVKIFSKRASTAVRHLLRT